MAVKIKNRITVPPEEEGARIDVFLSKRLKEVSRSRIQRCIASGGITRDGKEIKKNDLLSSGSVIEIDSSVSKEPEKGYPKPQDIPFQVIYRDRDIVAVNKPPGLAVHPGAGRRDNTLVNGLVFYFKNLSQGSEAARPGIVHRLDMDTSGVILVALNNRVHTRLSSMFASRSIHKTYKAFCIGKYPLERGDITAPIGRHRNNRVKWGVTETGKYAKTEYRVVKHRFGVTLVDFFPETGRTHQIRVHSSWSGFPVIGDSLYGGGKGVLKSLPPENRAFASKFFRVFQRHALHAYEIRFPHPITEQEMKIQAPLPDDFNSALRFME